MKIISNYGRAKTPDDTRTALNVAGTRATSQRALILEIIQQGQGHLDADEIYRQARVKQPRLSLSTVYRTLQTLKKLGLVDEVHIDETHHHYEAKQAAEHHHLVCLGCGRVIEFNYPLARQIKKVVPDARGFEFVSTELRAMGYCSQCRQKRE
jgi:Fur family ferric uptake transcriptional regulator